jgi:hypothetical protein
MQAVKTIGLDIAKSGFQVHAVDADGQVVFRRQLKRRNVLALFQKAECRRHPTHDHAQVGLPGARDVRYRLPCLSVGFRNYRTECSPQKATQCCGCDSLQAKPRWWPPPK